MKGCKLSFSHTVVAIRGDHSDPNTAVTKLAAAASATAPTRRAFGLAVLTGLFGLIAVPMAVADDPDTDRTAYTTRAGAELQEWRRKIHDFGERAEVKGHDAGRATHKGLETAWTNTQAESHKLRDATAAGWQEARRSYERASHSLAEAWHKADPDN